MKSRKVLILGLLVIFLASIFVMGCGGGEQKKTEAPKKEAPKTIVMRLGDVHPIDYPTVIGNLKFAELVGQKTNGRIKIEVYPSGQLGDEKAVIEQVQLGAIEFTRISASPLGEFSKPYGVFSLPYIFDNVEHLWRLLESPEGKALLVGLESSRMRGLAYYASGTRSFYGSQPLNSIADIKGKKIRVQQSKIAMDMITALGASPTPMPMGEVFTALQTGTIDGAENNFPSYLSGNHYQVAKYYINDQHQMVPEVLLMSKVAWDKLSAEDKKIIEDAAWESIKFQVESWNKFEKEAREKVIAAGAIVVDVADLSPWQAAVKPMVDGYRDEFKAQFEAIEKYRKK
jgi:tripartite ATP-independent transporter DctP family solute receptor